MLHGSSCRSVDVPVTADTQCVTRLQSVVILILAVLQAASLLRDERSRAASQGFTPLSTHLFTLRHSPKKRMKDVDCSLSSVALLAARSIARVTMASGASTLTTSGASAAIAAFVVAAAASEESALFAAAAAAAAALLLRFWCLPMPVVAAVLL